MISYGITPLKGLYTHKRENQNPGRVPHSDWYGAGEKTAPTGYAGAGSQTIITA